MDIVLPTAVVTAPHCGSVSLLYRLLGVNCTLSERLSHSAHNGFEDVCDEARAVDMTVCSADAS